MPIRRWRSARRQSDHQRGGDGERGGTIQLDAGSTADRHGGLVIDGTGKLTGAGTVTVGTAAGTHHSGSGTVIASGGTLDLKGTVRQRAAAADRCDDDLRA